MANLTDLKIDWLRGGKSSYPIPMAASQSIYPRSGKFVTAATTGATLTADADTLLSGWVECGPWDYTNKCASTHFLSSGTARATLLNCIRDLTAVFRMPLHYAAAVYITNYADTLIGYLRDIVTSTYQYCDMTNGSVDVLVVVGGKAATAVNVAGSVGDGYVDVMMSPAHAIGV